MKYKLILLAILIVGAILRLISLAYFPAGLNADEAALGYNAYSLMLTGRDEHGHSWPINLESFGDYKPALYAYILIPFIKVLGLTELAVRLPSAVLGIAAILGIYLLVHSLFRDEILALITAAILAVSPWHLHFSRGAWEVNIATTFLLFGTWLVIKWTQAPKFKYLIGGVLAFVLSMYSYQSARVIAPLLGLGLFFIYHKQFLKSTRQLVSSVGVLLLLLVPLGISILTTDASSRLSGVGLLADMGPVNRAEELRTQHPGWSLPVARLLHNRWVLYSIQFVSNYFDHFNADFLFVDGDEIERNKVPEMGQMYMTDLIFILIGIVALVKSKKLDPGVRVIWWWLAVAPVASALTFQTPHALRAHNLVVPLAIICAIGLYKTMKHWRKVAIGLLVIMYVWQVSYYLHQYYVHYPKTYPAAWQNGFKELVTYIEQNKDRFEQVWVTDKYDQPYILFLFYSQFPPQEFQANHQLTVRDKFNFSTVREYDNYRFESTNWDKVRDTHPILIAAAPEDIPEVGVNIVKTIYFPNGEPAFKIVFN